MKQTNRLCSLRELRGSELLPFLVVVSWLSVRTAGPDKLELTAPASTPTRRHPWQARAKLPSRNSNLVRLERFRRMIASGEPARQSNSKIDRETISHLDPSFG